MSRFIAVRKNKALIGQRFSISFLGLQEVGYDELEYTPVSMDPRFFYSPSETQRVIDEFYDDEKRDKDEDDWKVAQVKLFDLEGEELDYL